jgi:hypothetical protein
MEMFLQLVQTHFAVYRDAVAHYVKIVFPEINDALALRILYPGITNIPLLGDGPIKNRSAAWNFVDKQRNFLAQPIHGLPKAFAGDAATDGIDLFHEPVHIPSHFGWIDPALKLRNVDSLCRYHVRIERRFQFGQRAEAGSVVNT